MIKNLPIKAGDMGLIPQWVRELRSHMPQGNSAWALQQRSPMLQLRPNTVKKQTNRLFKKTSIFIKQKVKIQDSCCCCCYVASVVSNSVQPHRWQPTRLRHPWDSPGKNPGVGCHFLLQCMKEKSETEVTQSCPTLSDPMDCSLSGSSIHEFSRQEYWSGVPLPSPI